MGAICTVQCIVTCSVNVMHCTALHAVFIIMMYCTLHSALCTMYCALHYTLEQSALSAVLLHCALCTDAAVFLSEWRWSRALLYGFWCIHKISPRTKIPPYNANITEFCQISEIHYHFISTQCGKGDIVYQCQIRYVCRKDILCLKIQFL